MLLLLLLLNTIARRHYPLNTADIIIIVVVVLIAQVVSTPTDVVGQLTGCMIMYVVVLVRERVTVTAQQRVSAAT